MTFSLAGRCARTGMIGAIVTSSSPAVAARCVYARAHVGAVCTQNITDPRLGPQILDLLEEGQAPEAALAAAVAIAPFVEFRQLAVIDAEGRVASHSGKHTLGLNRVVEGRDCIAAGNLLADASVPAAMTAAFERDPGAHLGHRLLAALRAGDAAGGEEGPVHSCGFVIVADVPWPAADLRVDWADEDAIEKLAEVWKIYEPQLDAYVVRALDPRTAPSYGVPGDL